MRARPALALLALLAAAPARAADHDSTLKLAAVYGLPAAADLYTSQRLFDRGLAREGNPLGKSLDARIAINAGAATVLVLGTQRLQDGGHRKAARVLKIVYVVTRAALVANSLRIEVRR